MPQGIFIKDELTCTGYFTLAGMKFFTVVGNENALPENNLHSVHLH